MKQPPLTPREARSLKGKIEDLEYANQSLRNTIRENDRQLADEKIRISSLIRAEALGREDARACIAGMEQILAAVTFMLEGVRATVDTLARERYYREKKAAK